MWIGLSISWSFINRAVIVRGKGILFDLVRESQGILVEVWDYWDYLSKLGRSFPLVISSIYCCFNSLSFFWQFFSFSNFPIIYLQEGSLHISWKSLKLPYNLNLNLNKIWNYLRTDWLLQLTFSNLLELEFLEPCIPPINLCQFLFIVLSVGLVVTRNFCFKFFVCVERNQISKKSVYCFVTIPWHQLVLLKIDLGINSIYLKQKDMHLGFVAE